VANPSDDERTLQPGDKVWWKTPGMRHEATFLEMSASGKRARIRYEYNFNGVLCTQRSYVDPSRLERRDV
jgi:hypothetical protein